MATRDTFASIPLEKCVLCCSCGVVSNSSGERCRVCDGVGGLMNLQRILDGEPFAVEDRDELETKRLEN